LEVVEAGDEEPSTADAASAAPCDPSGALAPWLLGCGESGSAAGGAEAPFFALPPPAAFRFDEDPVGEESPAVFALTVPCAGACVAAACVDDCVARLPLLSPAEGEPAEEEPARERKKVPGAAV